MNERKIENLLNLSDEERYDYFVRKVAEYDEVWSLYHEKGWAVLSDNASRVIVPFWPEEEFASICCSSQWDGYSARKINLKDFMEKWLPGMEKDNRYVNVFYSPKTKFGLVIKPADLLQDLKQECENYL